MSSSFAVYHHLRECSSRQGIFSILAIDHRGVLVTDMEKIRGKTISRKDVVDFKRAVMTHLSEDATAVLLDPEYGFDALAGSPEFGHIGLLAPLELTDYTDHPSKRVTNFIEDWGVEKIKKSGCSGVKLLLYYHPEAENARSQTELVDKVVEQCQAHHIPFFLEPIMYSLDPQNPLSNNDLRRGVVESARHFTRRGIDILKVEFPVKVKNEPDEAVWEDALRELHAVCAVPWALLSAGVSFDVFLRQAILACKSGASGVMVGRAVWGDFLGHSGAALNHYLETVGKARMKTLRDVCNLYGAPWQYSIDKPSLGKNWFQNL